MKIEILATFPLCVILIFFTYKSAFTIEGDNMDCYQNAELIASTLFTRTASLIFFIVFVTHDQRRTQIRHFIGQERAKK